MKDDLKKLHYNASKKTEKYENVLIGMEKKWQAYIVGIWRNNLWIDEYHKIMTEKYSRLNWHIMIEKDIICQAAWMDKWMNILEINCSWFIQTRRPVNDTD